MPTLFPARHGLHAAVLLFGSFALAAQEPAPPRASLDDDAFLTPIHRLGSETGYGVWAAGPDYKASFHDGFTFYPVLGDAHPRNLPITWRTAAVVVGGRELREGPPRATWSAWQHETRHGPVVERYDVRRDGVEQSFVIERLPADAAGELVVVGRLETALAVAEPRDPAIAAVAAVRFADAAREPILEYGAALAFDAAGRRTPVATRVVGDTVELVVPADFVARAALPLTIDPLIRTVAVSSSGGALATCDVAWDDETNRLAVVYSRANSASDHDMWARVLDADLASVGAIFHDVTATWSNAHGSVAFVGGADRVAIAHERVYADASAVAVYLHPRASTTANVGEIALLVPPNDHSDRWPTIGGAPAHSGATSVFLAFRRDHTPTVVVETPRSAIRGAVLDCATRRFTDDDVPIAVSIDADREYPCISREHGAGAPGNWLLVWQERADRAAEPWQIRGVQVRADGTIGSVRSFGSTVGDLHNLRPKVDGRDGRYAIFWTDRVNSGFYLGGRGHRVRMQPVRWNDGLFAGVAGAPRSVVEDGYAAFDLGDGRAVGFDRMTRSHWAVGWRHAADGVEIARVGYDAGVAERVVVMADDPSYGQGAHPAVCFDDDGRRFPIVWRTDGPLKAVRMTALEYPAGAGTRVFGTGCQGVLSGRNEGNSPPYAGSEYFELRLRGAVPNAGVTLFAAAAEAPSPIPLPLSSGCFLLLDPQGVLFPVTSGVADAAGAFDLPMALPSVVGPAEVFWQAVQFGAFGTSSSRGLQTSIR